MHRSRIVPEYNSQAPRQLQATTRMIQKAPAITPRDLPTPPHPPRRWYQTDSKMDQDPNMLVINTLSPKRSLNLVHSQPVAYNADYSSMPSSAPVRSIQPAPANENRQKISLHLRNANRRSFPKTKTTTVSTHPPVAKLAIKTYLSKFDSQKIHLHTKIRVTVATKCTGLMKRNGMEPVY